MPISSMPTVSDKALRDFCYRDVILPNLEEIKLKFPGVTKIELSYFVNNLTSDQLTQVYGMFFRTGLAGQDLRK